MSAVTQNPLSIDTIFPVPCRGSVISHIKVDVLVNFRPLSFLPLNLDRNAHLPVKSLGRFFPSWILILHVRCLLTWADKINAVLDLEFLH